MKIVTVVEVSGEEIRKAISDLAQTQLESAGKRAIGGVKVRFFADNAPSPDAGGEHFRHFSQKSINLSHAEVTFTWGGK